MGDAWSDTVSYTLFGFPITIILNFRVGTWGDLTVPSFSNFPSLVLRTQEIEDLFGIQDTTWIYDWLVENWGFSASAYVDTNDSTSQIADVFDRLWMVQQTGVEEEETQFRLENAPSLSIQPNPMSHTTEIHFELSSQGPVSLKVYDLSGRLVRTLLDEESLPVFYTLPWDGRNRAGRESPIGLYFARLTQGSHTLTRKIILLRR